MEINKLIDIVNFQLLFLWYSSCILTVYMSNVKYKYKFILNIC